MNVEKTNYQMFHKRMHILRALRIKTLLLVLFLGGGGSVCFSREFLVGFFNVNLDAMFSL